MIKSHSSQPCREKTLTRWVLSLLIALLIPLTAEAQSQSVKLTGNNLTLRLAFNQIEKQTGVLFNYEASLLDVTQPIAKTPPAGTLTTVLAALLSNTGCTFTIRDKYVVIGEAKPKSPPKKIAGTVTDEKGEPVIGANVSIKGTTNGTITDMDGRFGLDTSEGTILVISYIGYTPKEIGVGGQSIYAISMAEDSQALDEVVVVGYGTVKKKDLTGAVSQVKTEQFSTQQATNLLNYLSGSVAGINVGSSTKASGESEIEVRGPTSLTANNQPLIVMDGVIFNGSIGDINPSDIESMDILKDASSAAVFGSRSAAGVVIINTKRGKGDKVTINLSAQLGTTGLTNNIRPFGGEGYLHFRQDFQERINANKPGAYYHNPNNLPNGLSIEDWQKYDAAPSNDPNETWMNRLGLRDIEKKNYLGGNTYDWYDGVRDNGIKQNYDANISGGTGVLKYYWSAGYTDNQNYLKGDNYKIVRTRLNTDAQVTSYLKIGLNAQFSTRDESSVPTVLGDAIPQSPYGQAFDEAGELKWYPHDDTGVTENPFMNYYKRDKFNVSQNLFANIYGELTLPFGFSFKTSYINRYDWGKNYFYDPSTTPKGNKTNGYAERTNNSLYEWQIDNVLTWKKTFGAHDFNATFLYNAEKKQTWKDVGNNIGFTTSEALGFHQLKIGSSPTIENVDTYSTGTALMARLNYTLMGKYMLTMSIRRDGYSAFGQVNPYANFPSAALAWNLSEEKFFKVNWVDNLKIRTSYGVNGNRDIGIYDALAQLGTTKYLSGSNLISGIYSSTMANRLLRWERTEAFNLGVDFSLFKGRLGGAIDAYQMKTTNLLLKRSLPAIIGYKNVMSNLGELDNSGMEMTINSRNIEQKKFSWNSSLVFSFNRNKIVHLYGEMINVVDAQGNVIGRREADDKENGWFIGQSIDRTWDYRFLGIYQQGEEEAAKSFGKAPGDTKLLDVDGNGISTQEDKEFLGYKKPRFRLGLRNDFSFLKNFNFSFFIRADLGHEDTNGMLMNTSNTGNRQNAYDKPYWTPTNPINTHTRLNTVNTPEFVIYESRGFVRLQDVSLSYTIPQKFIEKAKIGRCRVYVSSRNLLTFTKWTGWDPESGNTPMPKTFTFGIDVTL